MLTGMLAARNLLHSEANDLWAVNAEQEYLEEVRVTDEETNVSDRTEHDLSDC